MRSQRAAREGPALGGFSLLNRPLGHAVLVAAAAAFTVIAGTQFHAPPRFDGAGYAVLGLALGSGHGYHEIDHPDQPPHAHYPPGYPAALAVVWLVAGRSSAAAHAFSVACTVAAVLGAWLWFRSMYRPGVALGLALAVALNWMWVRAGGEIQSEPLYLLLSQAALLLALRAGRGTGRGLAPAVWLGLVLAACVLTRHMAVGLAVAIGMDLLLRGRVARAVTAGALAVALVAPWAVWLARVQHNTQVGLLARGSLSDTVAANALFYVRRLPDALAGPFIEVATVFRSSQVVAAAATAVAAVLTGLVVWGWWHAARTPRRRLAALVPACTLALLLVWPFTEAGRFLIPLVPFLLVGALEGLARLAVWVGLRRGRAWAVVMLLMAAIPYTSYSLLTNRAGAQQRSHAGFDAACAWLAAHADHPGPVLTRQPGEVYWLTGRQALLPPGDDPAAIDGLIDQYRVAYLLVEEERYARAPTNPLSRYVSTRPGRVVQAWQQAGDRPVAVYAVRR